MVHSFGGAVVVSFVGSFVGSLVGSLVGCVPKETEDEASTTTEVSLGKTALATGVELLIIADEDEKI